MPADPKPSGQRRRRNVGQAQPVRLGAAAGRRAPEAPDGLCEAAVVAWRSWWESPMAAIWLDADLPALIRLARLTDVAVRGEASAAVLGELRQLEDRFGLTPLARRRLAWEVEQATGEKPADVGGAAESETRWLRAVSN